MSRSFASWLWSHTAGGRGARIPIVYYARKLNRHIEDRFRLQLERDDLLELTALLNEKLERENRELAHRAAVLGKRHEDLAGKPFASLLAGPYAATKAFAGAREPISIEVEVIGRGAEAIACTASFTPLTARECRDPGFGVILSGCTVPA